MEQPKCLGIYISDRKAVGVLLSGHGTEFKVLACRTVEADPDQQDEQPLAAQIVKEIEAEKLTFDEISVAVDCGMFTQHNLHSEFSEYRQIANTIRFDAEEAVAMDTAELAVTFNVNSINETGSEVTVYTANREMMTETLTAMLKNGIDPTAIEPDIVCLARFIGKSKSLSGHQNRITVITGEKACYLIMPAEDHNQPSVRSFLTTPSQNLTSTLAREIPITVASLSCPEPITSIAIAGKTENIDTEELATRTGMDVAAVELIDQTDAGSDVTRESDFAIAYGAALAELTRTHKTDFREDFMPYEGRVRAIRKSLQIISAAVTIILLAAGAYFQVQATIASNQVKELEDKMYVEEAEVVFGSPHTSGEKFTSRLRRELSKIKSGKTGLSAGDEYSVTAKLGYLFEAINESNKNNNLKINKISISTKLIQLDGSTRNRGYTNELFKRIDDHPKLRTGRSNVITKVNEDTFTVSIELQN